MSAPKRTRPSRNPTPARPGAAPRRRARSRLAAVGATLRRYGFVLVAFAVVAGAVAVGVYQGLDQRAGDTEPVPTEPERPFRSDRELLAGKPAPELFGHACGSCHTLSAAKVKGVAGPNLDGRRLAADYVERMILNGSVSGAMPARMLEGAEARRVARYVARVSRASRGGNG